MRSRLSLAAVLAVLVPFCPASAAPAPELRPKIEIDRPLVPQGRETEVNVVVRFDAPPMPPRPDRRRPDLNLALVIDRSGSMAERGKLEYAREAAMRVVDGLRPTDRLAVVEYDDRITVLWPSSRVENPGLIKQRIGALAPRGNTNLTGGMLQGVEEAMRDWSPRDLTRVILLSDGLANEGITDRAAIAALARQARERGARITALGLGAEYDEDLMQAVAQNGGGRYAFIESPRMMARIFEEELSMVAETVARDIRVTFTAAGPVDSVEVLGYPHEKEGRGVRIDQRDLSAGEERSMVLRLRLRALPEGEASLGRIALAYRDEAAGKTVETGEEVRVRATPSEEEVARAENAPAAAEAVLAQAEQVHEESARLYEAGRKDEALAKIAEAKERLAARNETLASAPVAAKIEAFGLEAGAMADADASGEARSVYLKKTKQRAYEGRQGRREALLLQPGDSGLEVERLQAALRAQGVYAGPVDGRFTEEVRAAVLRLQQDKGLRADGVAGPATLKELGLY